VRTLTWVRVNRATNRGASAEERHRSDVIRVPSEDPNDKNGPLHVLLDFGPEENAPLAAYDNATLIERVRKRTRRVGVRCNLTLQLVPGDGGDGGDGPTRSVLHATPLRASRGLALRHIVQRFDDLSMTTAVYVCTPASVHAKSSKQGYTLLGTLCSDTAPLVEGAQKVLIVPPSRQMQLSRSLDDVAAEVATKSASASGRDRTAFEKLKVTLEPYSEARIHVLSDAMAVREALDRVVLKE
jgi:hypothetical protein